MKVLEYFKSMTAHIPGEVTLISEVGMRNKGRGSWKSMLLNLVLPFIRFRDKLTWRFFALVGNDTLYYLEYDCEDEEVLACFPIPFVEMTDIEVNTTHQGYMHHLEFVFREKKLSYDVMAYPSIYLMSEIGSLPKEVLDGFKQMTDALISKIRSKGAA